MRPAFPAVPSGLSLRPVPERPVILVHPADPVPQVPLVLRGDRGNLSARYRREARADREGRLIQTLPTD